MQEAQNHFLEKLNILYENENLFFMYLKNENTNDFGQTKQNLYDNIDNFITNSNISIVIDLLRSINRTILCIPLKNDEVNRAIALIDYILLEKNFSSILKENMIFNIFENNKYILLHLYNNKILSISSLLFFLRNAHFQNVEKNVVIFFLPEIIEFSSQIYFELIRKIIKKHSLEEEYKYLKNNPDDLEKYRNQRSFHTSARFLEIIRNDDIDKFVSLIFETHFDIYKKLDAFSDFTFDSNIYFSHANKMSLLEYSMAFGAASIYNYISQNSTITLNKSSLKYAILGGNYNIIHSIDSKNDLKYDKNCYEISIEAHREEITEYLSSSCNFQIEQLEELSKTFEYYNFTHLFKNISNDQEYFCDFCQNGHIVSLIGSIPCASVFELILEIPDFHINSKNRIFSYFYGKFLFLLGIFFVF